MLCSGLRHWGGEQAIGAIAGRLPIGLGSRSVRCRHRTTALSAWPRPNCRLTDHCVVAATHTGLLFSGAAAGQVVAFLRSARFEPCRIDRSMPRVRTARMLEFNRCAAGEADVRRFGAGHGGVVQGRWWAPIRASQAVSRTRPQFHVSPKQQLSRLRSYPHAPNSRHRPRFASHRHRHHGYGRGRRVAPRFHCAVTVLDNDNFPLRLKQIFDETCALIEQHHPDEVAIERVFMARNADSALKLGQARGAAICAVVHRGLGVTEYAAKEIKQAIVGRGAAGKGRSSTW